MGKPGSHALDQVPHPIAQDPAGTVLASDPRAQSQHTGSQEWMMLGPGAQSQCGRQEELFQVFRTQSQHTGAGGNSARPHPQGSIPAGRGSLGPWEPISEHAGGREGQCQAPRDKSQHAGVMLAPGPAPHALGRMPGPRAQSWHSGLNLTNKQAPPHSYSLWGQKIEHQCFRWRSPT